MTYQTIQTATHADKVGVITLNRRARRMPASIGWPSG